MSTLTLENAQPQKVIVPDQNSKTYADNERQDLRVLLLPSSNFCDQPITLLETSLAHLADLRPRTLELLTLLQKAVSMLAPLIDDILRELQSFIELRSFICEILNVLGFPICDTT